MLEMSWPLPWLVSVPSRRSTIWGCCWWEEEGRRKGATAVNRDLGWKRAGREMVGCGGGAFWWILGERASKLTIICPLGIRMKRSRHGRSVRNAPVAPIAPPTARSSCGGRGRYSNCFCSRPSRSGRTTSCRLFSLALVPHVAGSTDGLALTRLRARSVERRAIARPTCRPSRDTPARSDRVAGSWITEPRTRATQKRFPAISRTGVRGSGDRRRTGRRRLGRIGQHEDE